MADKPRLKDTDEIFSSLGKKRKVPPLPSILGREVPMETASLPAEDVQPEPEPQQEPQEQRDREPQKRPVARRSRAPKEVRPEPVEQAVVQPEPEAPAMEADMSAQEMLPEPVEDKMPLDFGKYQLPTREQLTVEAAPTSPEPVASVAPIESPKPTRRRSARKPKTQRAEPVETPAAEEVLTEEGPKLVQPYQFEDLSMPEQAPEEQPITPEAAVVTVEAPVAAEERIPAKKKKKPKPALEQTEPPVRQTVEEPVNKPDKRDEREDFLKRLSSQFDEAFAQRFEGQPVEEPSVFGEEPPKPAVPPKTSRRSRRKGQSSVGLDLTVTPNERARTPEPNADIAAPMRERPQVELEPSEDGAELAEADSFLEQFAQQVREEESERVEQFKDTLEEKFERERARYLKELGLDGQTEDLDEYDDEEPEEEVGFRPPEHRRLDLQIQPDMHRSADDDARPVTYSRTGAVRPLDEADDEPDDPYEAENVIPFDPSGKKTPEQLLLELAAHNTHREAIAQKALERQLHKQFQFVTPEEQDEQESKQETDKKAKKTKKAKAEAPEGSFFSRHRIGVLSSLAAMIVVVMIAMPVLLRLLTVQNAEEGGTTTSDGSAISGDAYTILESRNFDERAEYDDVLIKRSNISVTNMTVNNLLVIDEISSPGNIHLENITVGGAIYLQNCAVDSLTLHNVSAQRIVLSNTETDVSVTISGSGMVETVEIKTPAKINNIPQQGAEGYGVRDIVLRGAQNVDTLNVSLSGMDLVSVAAYGRAVLDLDENTFIERMSVEGSLSLSGSGRVLTLSAGPEEEERIVLSLGEASISHCNVKGEADINLSTQVDSLVVADHFALAGNGRVSMLTLDARMDGGRLLADLSGIDVQTLIANTEARVNVVGGGRVGELTANDSVYALGNKLSHLVVNANGVVYENEPDKISVASGIRPPETMADNPNLDYNLSSAQNIRPLEAEDDDVATLCGHTRESGGFLRGDGSRNNPYEVSTPAQLAHIGMHLDSHFVQTEDINISDDTQFITGFPMIAGDKPFSGSYDGNGFQILNLRISSGDENIGLFAENIGTIQNVTIASGEIKTSTESRSFVGSIVGMNYQGGVVENCANEARVSGNASSYVGGLVGYNYGGRIRNSYNLARVSGTYNVGGIAGVNRDDAVVSGSYNAGAVEGTSETGSVVGTNSEGIVTNCYYLDSTATEGIGSGTGTATARTLEEMAGAQMVADLSAGSDASPWTRGSGSYTYPVLEIATRASSTPGEESSSMEVVIE